MRIDNSRSRVSLEGIKRDSKQIKPKFFYEKLKRNLFFHNFFTALDPLWKEGRQFCYARTSIWCSPLDLQATIYIKANAHRALVHMITISKGVLCSLP